MTIMMLASLYNQAIAGDWTVERDWKIASALGPVDPSHSYFHLTVGMCRIGPNGPTMDGEYTLPYHGYCLATDASQSWTTGDSRFAFSTSDVLTNDDTGEDYIVVTLSFEPGLDSSGQWVNWPTSLPSYVEASETFGSYTHTYRVNLVNDDMRLIRTEMPPVTPAVLLTTTSVINVPSTWVGYAKAKWVQAPNGTYSGSSSTEYVKMITTPNIFGVAVSGTACKVWDGDQTLGEKDFVEGVARESVSAGTYYCKVVKNGTVIYKPFQVTH